MFYRNELCTATWKIVYKGGHVVGAALVEPTLAPRRRRALDWVEHVHHLYSSTPLVVTCSHL